MNGVNGGGLCLMCMTRELQLMITIANCHWSSLHFDKS